MSDLADMLRDRADREAEDAVAADRPVTDTTYAALVELQRTFKHLGIAVLDGLPWFGPWALRQLTDRSER